VPTSEKVGTLMVPIRLGRARNRHYVPISPSGSLRGSGRPNRLRISSRPPCVPAARTGLGTNTRIRWRSSAGPWSSATAATATGGASAPKDGKSYLMLDKESLVLTVKTKVDQAVQKTGYRIVKGGDARRDIDAAAAATIARVRPYTALSAERLVAVRDAAIYVERYEIEGSIIECGVWRGGAMMMAALTLLELGSRSRDIYLFDTYEGMTAPTDIDRDSNGVLAADQMDHVKMAVSVEEVQRNLYSTGYPREKLHFVKGPVEETVPGQAPPDLAVLRLDTDWYESTRHELEHLVPRVVPNGVLLIDDYGTWQGARKAVDEYVAVSDKPILLSRTDTTGRMAIIPGS
jgi:O-methyltransferase